MRFNMVMPELDRAENGRRHQAMLDMVRYADANGFDGISLEEHHGAFNGWSSSPLILAGLIFGASTKLQVSISALLKLLPLGVGTQEFVEGAQLREGEEIARISELWETWAWRVDQEDQARAVLADPELDLDIDVDALAEEIKKEGFDDRAASAKGKGHRAAEALRFLGKKAAERMASEKLIGKLTNGDFGFKGMPVFALADEALDDLRRISNERSHALTWITTGGGWDDVDDAFAELGDLEEG